MTAAPRARRAAAAATLALALLAAAAPAALAQISNRGPEGPRAIQCGSTTECDLVRQMLGAAVGVSTGAKPAAVAAAAVAPANVTSAQVGGMPVCGTLGTNTVACASRQERARRRPRPPPRPHHRPLPRRPPSLHPPPPLCQVASALGAVLAAGVLESEVLDTLGNPTRFE